MPGVKPDHESIPGTPTTSLSPSPLPVIPPIITCERDRHFLIELTNSIDSDLSQIEDEDNEQRYNCYSSAFNKIIEHVDAYKPLLTAIKAEYEDCINTIKRGRQEALYLSGRLKTLASEPSTLRNYRRRGDDLEQKMSVIQTDNDRLREQLADLRAARSQLSHSEQEQHADQFYGSEQQPAHPPPKRDPRPIPGLNLQQSTDVKVLRKELEKLERQLKELNIAHRTRYSPAQVKDHLKGQLSHKVELRDQLAEQLDLMKAKRHKLKIAVEAAQAYLKIQPPHQTIGDAVVTSLIRANTQALDRGGEDGGGVRGTPSTTFEDDDPTREKEAEMMLEYIEKFNELLEDGLVEEAALHAANSPKGILRTPETLNRFKDIGFRTNEGRKPLLAFCEALMATVDAFGLKPNELVSHECVRCALEENRLDLLVHWVSQDRLTLTEQLGRTIEQWSSSPQPDSGATPRSAMEPGTTGAAGGGGGASLGLSTGEASRRLRALALTVYRAVGAHVPAVVCMLKQGRPKQAADYAKGQARLQAPDYVAILHQCPSPELVAALFPEDRKGALLGLGVLVTTLMRTDAYHLGLELLVRLHQQDASSSTLLTAVMADDVTTTEEWRDIAERLNEQGSHQVALRLMAAVLTVQATRGAMVTVKEIREKEAQEEKRKREEREAEEKRQQAGKKGKKKKARIQRSDLESIETASTDRSEGPAEQSRDTLQLTRKTRRVEISDQVHVQSVDGGWSHASCERDQDGVESKIQRENEAISDTTSGLVNGTEALVSSSKPAAEQVPAAPVDPSIDPAHPSDRVNNSSQVEASAPPLDLLTGSAQGGQAATAQGLHAELAGSAQEGAVVPAHVDKEGKTELQPKAQVPTQSEVQTDLHPATLASTKAEVPHDTQAGSMTLPVDQSSELLSSALLSPASASIEISSQLQPPTTAQASLVPESSTLESSGIDERGPDSDHYMASGGETSDAPSEGMHGGARRRRMPHGARMAAAGASTLATQESESDRNDDTINEGYEADVE